MPQKNIITFTDTSYMIHKRLYYTLDYFLQVSPFAKVNRSIYKGLLMKWASFLFMENIPSDYFVEVFQWAKNIYMHINNDEQPEEHMEDFIDYTLNTCYGARCKGDQLISLFIAYIWLKINHDDWRIMALCEQLQSTDWSSYIILPLGRDKSDASKVKDKINDFFIISNNLADAFLDLKKRTGLENINTDRTMRNSNQEEKPQEQQSSDGKQLTNRQLIILFEALLNVELTSTGTNISAFSRLISAVSNKSSESIRQLIKKGVDYDRKDVKKDVEKVADLLNDIAYPLAQKMRNDIQKDSDSPFKNKQ